jgi:VIT1/CCC1 family predicted Fe2+/Mn2+ transporter
MNHPAFRIPSLHTELHANSSSSKLNWLRAAVLGSNDGIVSVAALVVGVAGATTSSSSILITGIAGLVAGSLSMAVGEYVSVSSQRDTEEALLAKERRELEEFPDAELEELTKIYENKGVSRATAEVVARELTTHDAFGAHVDAELHINPEALTNPWQAAFASAISFALGAAIPVIAIVTPPENNRIVITFVAVILALAITGVLSAKVSDSSVSRVTVRVVVGGVIAMIVTFGIGKLFGLARV